MFARTQRLLLRPGWPEDAVVLQAAIADQAIIRNTSRIPWPYELKDAEEFLSSGWNPVEPKFLIFNRTKGAPRLVGGCGIQSTDDGRKELGYWIARPFWGLGFATEAAGAVMQIARATGLNSVFARHTVDNPASGRVLRKIGFHPTGRTQMAFSPSRGFEVETVLYEDSGIVPMHSDTSHELYEDQPVAA